MSHQTTEEQARPDRFLRIERGLYAALLPAAVLYGLLSGISWPGVWAATHHLFDYSHGLAKRSLFGELLRHVVAPPYSYSLIAAIGFAVFAIWLALLLRGLAPLNGASKLMLAAAALAFTSPGFVFLVHEIGYFDHVGLIVCLLCILLPRWRPSALLPVQLALCTVALLTHEAFLLFSFPIVLFDYMLRYRDAGSLVRWGGLALLAVPSLAVAWALGNLHYPAAMSQEFAAYISGKAAGFTPSQLAIETLFRSGADNFKLMAGYWSDTTYRFQLVRDFLVTAPLALFFIGLAATRLRGLASSRTFIAAALAAGFSPLLLHLVAWDSVRFNAVLQMTSFLVLFVTARHLGVPVVSAAAQHLTTMIIVMFVALNFGTMLPLFNGLTMSKIPFAVHFKTALDVMKGAPFVRIPSQ